MATFIGKTRDCILFLAIAATFFYFLIFQMDKEYLKTKLLIVGIVVRNHTTLQSDLDSEFDEKTPIRAKFQFHSGPEPELAWPVPVEDLYKMSYQNLSSFFAFKEAQYQKRREMIVSHCKQVYGVYPMPLEKALPRFCLTDFDSRHNMTYCGIAKVICGRY